MRDAQSLLRAKGLQPLAIERAEPKDGERYFVGHRVVRAGEPVEMPLPVVLDTPAAYMGALIFQRGILGGLALGAIAIGALWAGLVML